MLASEIQQGIIMPQTLLVPGAVVLGSRLELLEACEASGRRCQL